MRTVTQVGDVGPGLVRVQMLPDLGRALDRDQDKEAKQAQHRQAA